MVQLNFYNGVFPVFFRTCSFRGLLWQTSGEAASPAGQQTEDAEANMSVSEMIGLYTIIGWFDKNLSRELAGLGYNYTISETSTAQETRKTIQIKLKLRLLLHYSSYAYNA